MKQKLSELAQRYETALRTHLQPGNRTSRQPALELGRQAAALGMETLELARVHEHALTTLAVAERKNQHMRRAEVFFTEAITPIVENHRSARQNQSDLNRLKKTLNQRTLELAEASRQLKNGVLRRKAVEVALERSGIHYGRLLKDSLLLQENLRQLTHQVLVAQEEERKKISHELQNEVAQTLLGINVRLLSLKEEAKINTQGLKAGIASTQRLVARSAQSVRKVARGFEKI